MSIREKTGLGGQNEAFQTTQWTQIFDARAVNPDRRRAAMEELLGRYWKPVYCYLRGNGHDNESAKDLTQGFFHQVVLRRKLIQQADRKKGKFRTFLLTALDRYARNVRRDATAKKRVPAGQLVRLDAIDSAFVPDAARNVAPEAAFHYAWASELLDRVLARAEQDCRHGGLTVHWEMFQAKVVEPILQNSRPPSLSELCAKHSVEGENRASNMIVTVKRHLRVALESCVREFAGPAADLEEEIGDLLRILSRGRAG